MGFTAMQVNSPMFYVRSSATDNTIIANIASTSSTVLFDPRGMQSFPATNCVQINMQGPWVRRRRSTISHARSIERR